jgi:molybdate transport system substrate-binding protein
MIATLLAAQLFVHAAASLTDALHELGAVFERHTGVQVVFNFGASSIVARQIEQGAPADVFLSADEAKVDALARKHLVVARRDLLTNTLVVAVARDSRVTVRGARDLLRLSRIAIAQPDSVPAGIYAKEWLQRSGLWTAIAPRLIPTENVRAALAAVEAGNADAAFVYRTDLTARSRIALEIHGLHIVYPVAIVRDSPAARRFVDFLQSATARRIFTKYGFGVP